MTWIFVYVIEKNWALKQEIINTSFTFVIARTLTVVILYVHSYYAHIPYHYNTIRMKCGLDIPDVDVNVYNTLIRSTCLILQPRIYRGLRGKRWQVPTV